LKVKDLYQWKTALSRRGFLPEKKLKTTFVPVATEPATASPTSCNVTLPNGVRINYADRAHFFAMAARLMRRVLVDLSRSRNASKRDGVSRVTLTPNMPVEKSKPVDILHLDEALIQLKEIEAA